MRPRLAMLVVAAAAALGGCGCGDTRARPRDAGPDEPVRFDAGEPPVDGALDAVVGDAGPPRPDAMDAMPDAADGDAPDVADAALDAGPDTGPDGGCRAGLTACIDEHSGELVCVDLLRNACHCRQCEDQGCLACFDGWCDFECPFSQCRRGGGPCSDDTEYVCTDLSSDPQHCGACWHACAPGMPCHSGVCGDLFYDAGPDAAP